jgi:hypothetical protein
MEDVQTTLVKEEDLLEPKGVGTNGGQCGKFHFWVVCPFLSLFVDEVSSNQSQPTRIIETHGELLG